VHLTDCYAITDAVGTTWIVSSTYKQRPHTSKCGPSANTINNVRNGRLISLPVFDGQGTMNDALLYVHHPRANFIDQHEGNRVTPSRWHQYQRSWKSSMSTRSSS